MDAAQKKIFPYAIVVLFAYIGFALPLPILPEMFLDPERAILPSSYSIGKKTLLLGVLMSSFPLGQFFGAPLLGRLSDLFGRKRVILISLLGSTFGYLLTAAAASLHSVTGLFLGLAVCGFCEGNIGIAQSVIADLTRHEPPAVRARHFGMINVFISLGFIIGPFIGGQLADPNMVSWFSFSTPFWMAAVMTLCGIGVIYWNADETRRSQHREKWRFWETIFGGFKRMHLRTSYWVNFFLALSFFSYFRFLPVFLERTFNMSAAQLAYVMIYDSLWIGAASKWIVPFLSKYLSASRTLFYSAPLMALFFVLCLIPRTPYALLLTIPPIGLLIGIVITNGSILISEKSHADFQGQALGTLIAVQVVAEFATGIGGGMIASATPGLPISIGAIMAICGSIILAWRRRFRDKSEIEKKG